MSLIRVRGPIFAAADPPTWAGATWIGQLWVDDRHVAAPSEHLELEGAQGFARARLLVRTGAGVPLGMANVAIRDGMVAGADLITALAQLPAAPKAAGEAAARLRRAELSVVLCTRERPEALRTALTGVLSQNVPAARVIVVENAPITDATRRVVSQVAGERVQLVTEPVPGLSRARNAGVAAAQTEWVAFTDDDVIPDSGWLGGIEAGIARGGTNTACVTGLVPTGELRTPAQAWFDARIGWNRVFTPAVFHRDYPPVDVPLFPFQVGRFGAGANFAARRDVIARLGGFDRHLGAGTPARGGEDIDFFFRLVVAGHTLVYEPSAIVWHQHRETQEALVSQAEGYGSGFSAWVTKTVLSPRTLARAGLIAARSFRQSRPPRPARTDPAGGTSRAGSTDGARRAGAGLLAPFRDYIRPMHGQSLQLPLDVDVLAIEHRATLRGPAAYVRSRVGERVRRAQRG